MCFIAVALEVKTLSSCFDLLLLLCTKPHTYAVAGTKARARSIAASCAAAAVLLYSYSFALLLWLRGSAAAFGKKKKPLFLIVLRA